MRLNVARMRFIKTIVEAMKTKASPNCERTPERIRSPKKSAIDILDSGPAIATMASPQR